MCLKLTPEKNSIAISYELQWLAEVMTISAGSMVPFTFFTVPAKEKGRSYPRSENPGFVLGKEGKVDTKPSAGGRKHVDYNHLVPDLCALFAPGAMDLTVPLGDIAILSKRAVCVEVLRTFKGSRHFQVCGGAPLPPSDKRYPGWPVHGYPMLCVVGGESTVFPSSKGDYTQGEWRVVQCVFGAALTGLIRKMNIGIEVVSREGFGSVFPTLADLPHGIRLDPGLLPPKEGGVAIVEALKFVGDFIDEMRKLKLPQELITKLNGYDSAPLAGVDRLMSVLLSFAHDKPNAAPKAYAELVARQTGGGSDCKLEPVKGKVGYVIDGVLAVDKPPKFMKMKRRELKIDSGYGSDSDYEQDEAEDLEKFQIKEKDETPLEKLKLKANKDEEQVSVRGPFAIKKISVLSGMAALRMATQYGMNYSKWLFTKGSLKDADESKSSSIIAWAPYFELDYADWEEVKKPAPGVHILIFDGAPNPINIVEKLSKEPKKLGAIVIDTTNNTSREKALYLAFFQKYLAEPENPELAGGLLLMVDSASKHPTGGDLVHGVMRVCGRRASVETFFSGLLLPHLGLANSSAKTLTVLSEDETAARREMIKSRLVMRNSDIWQWFGKL